MSFTQLVPVRQVYDQGMVHQHTKTCRTIYNKRANTLQTLTLRAGKINFWTF